jgi:hypothetical protein
MPFPSPVRRDPEHRLEVRLFGSAREILRMARGWLRGKGHVWQVTGRAMVCDRCLASVLVDPPPKAVLVNRLAHPVRALEDGTVVYRRRLLQRRYPGPSEVRSVRGHFPACGVLREALVDSVADR